MGGVCQTRSAHPTSQSDTNSSQRFLCLGRPCLPFCFGGLMSAFEAPTSSVCHPPASHPTRWIKSTLIISTHVFTQMSLRFCDLNNNGECSIIRYAKRLVITIKHADNSEFSSCTNSFLHKVLDKDRALCMSTRDQWSRTFNRVSLFGPRTPARTNSRM